MKGGTKEGAKNAIETKRENYKGKGNPFAKWGSQGGEARNKSPKKYQNFEDKDAAASAGAKGAAIRWAKYRAEKAAREAEQLNEDK